MRQIADCLENSSQDSAKMLGRLAQIIAIGLHAERFSIFLVDSDLWDSAYRTFHGVGDYSPKAESLTGKIIGKTFTVEVESELANLMKSRVSFEVEKSSKALTDKSPHPLLSLPAETSNHSVMIFPLHSERRLNGFISLYCSSFENRLAPETVHLAELVADYLAIKLASLRLTAKGILSAMRDEISNGVFNNNSSAELISNLSKQLSWERWVRQIICKMHASLDRDLVLQSVVDGFGRSLAASRCLIVKTDGTGANVVTHEYVEPEVSPLGLGRTGVFPLAAITPFRHKSAVIPDIDALLKSGDLSDSEYEYFAENNLRAMAGAPIAIHGNFHGVIIILERHGRHNWAPHELDMLEVVASQTAIALGKCQAYRQIKDQLFNMNLIGNLTHQLTSTLESVVKDGLKNDQAQEKAKLALNAPPLSLRELEVLKLIASGLANREIAQRLFLTESTVELHASRIRKKLKLKSRTALVKYACDNGLA
jgi:DNA-binding CsgD family transcriptional regulator